MFLEEVDSLMGYMERLMTRREDYFLGHFEDAVDVLTQSLLSSEQRLRFLKLAVSLLDLGQFPNYGWRKEIEIEYKQLTWHLIDLRSVEV